MRVNRPQQQGVDREAINRISYWTWRKCHIATGKALAANLGFVRWPDYLDFYILASTALTAVSFFVLKAVVPKGKSYSEVPKAERTRFMTVVAFAMILSLVATMGMIFVGMGLQRATE